MRKFGPSFQCNIHPLPATHAEDDQPTCTHQLRLQTKGAKGHRTTRQWGATSTQRAANSDHLLEGGQEKPHKPAYNRPARRTMLITGSDSNQASWRVEALFSQLVSCGSFVRRESLSLPCFLFFRKAQQLSSYSAREVKLIW